MFGSSHSEWLMGPKDEPRTIVHEFDTIACTFENLQEVMTELSKTHDTASLRVGHWDYGSALVITAPKRTEDV